MAEVSVIKEVFRGTAHAVVMRDASGYSFKALTAYGRRLAPSGGKMYSLSDVSLPDGMFFSDFKKVKTSAKDLLSGLFVEQSHNEKQIANELIAKSSCMLFSGRNVIIPVETKNAKIKDETGLSKFSSINYRARKFKNEVKAASAYCDIAKGIGGYNKATHSFRPHSQTGIQALAIDKVKSAIGDGALRRFVGGHRAALSGLGMENRRLERRVKSLLQAEDEEKQLSIQQRFSESIKCLVFRR